MPERQDIAVPYTWREFQAGAAAAMPLAVSAGIYGIVFGAVAAQAGLELVVATAMSALVFAGGAQLACMPLWTYPLPIVALTAMTLAVNARYFLQSASLRPKLANGNKAKTYGSLFILSDGGWALSMHRWRSHPIDGGYLFGTNFVQAVPWMVCTLVGHAIGNRIGSPATFGLDFIFPAVFAAMAAHLWRKRSDIGPVVVGAGAAVLASRYVPGHWTILIGGFAGSLVGAFAHGRKS